MLGRAGGTESPRNPLSPASILSRFDYQHSGQVVEGGKGKAAAAEYRFQNSLQKIRASRRGGSGAGRLIKDFWI